MGCDIHIWVERKQTSARPDAPWLIVESADIVGEPRDDFEREYGRKVYDGRNYDLFAMLANVRNGGGFVPIPVALKLPHEDGCRGIPLDASAVYREHADRWDVDGHSHSWATLAELKAYDWTGQKTLRWGTAYAEAAGSFYQDTLPALEKYAREHNIPDTDLRIVFFFDN